MQLNTAYPSGAYLSAFFKNQGCKTAWFDLNISLFDAIFCRSGLEKLFSLCSKKAVDLADSFERAGNSEAAFNLRRYISTKDLWLNWIDTITAILRPAAGQGTSYESAHRFAFGAHVPRGARMERYLQGLDHQLTTDDARSLASYAIADLADFITAVFDENFALVRYAESLTVSESSFEKIASGADSPVLKTFYLPVLENLIENPRVKELINVDSDEKTLVCVSLPFAGTFTPALATGKFFKQKFGENVFVTFGGGFINTELRETNEAGLFDFCDALSYDRGYGSYWRLMESALLKKSHTDCFRTNNVDGHFDPSTGSGHRRLNDRIQRTEWTVAQIYKLRLFTAGSVIEPAESDDDAQNFEKEQTASIVPDFSDIDYSRYPLLIDDTNPMHRLWSDGAWIKAYMAHGCYWHQCAFCDVTLDYVCGYCPTDIKKLYEGLLATCREKKVYGIHFVDEAMPPAMMLAFAKENISHGSPISWWGNIRFEKFFTRDVADFLAYGGLVGVSGGLEIATGNGLDAIHKGIDLAGVVQACCAFKEAGILVHAYMIYGYWMQKAQDLINSMETLRQFYAAGLLDSSFWHKFVLTRHSRVYKEWKEGKWPDLKPLEEKEIPLFAKNGLHFKGEEKSEKFGPALEYSLDEWMHGRGLERPVQSWFDFDLPKPTVKKDFIAKNIELYEQKRDEAFAAPLPEDKNRIYWLGGDKIQVKGGKKISWIYMGEESTEKADAEPQKFRGRGLCVLPG